jgi:hypothetical protein
LRATKATGTSPHFSSARDLGNGGMVEQFLLDLRGVDVHTTADDHVYTGINRALYETAVQPP